MKSNNGNGHGAKLALAKEQLEKRGHAQLTNAQQQQQVIQASMLVGGAVALETVGRKIAEQLSSATFRALEQLAETEAYKALGFETFVDFLNSSYSPLNKSQFYERKALLEREGDQTFDLLNSLNVPITVRRRLGSGMVTVDGDTILVGSDRFELESRAQIVEVIKTLANKTVQQERTIEKGKQQLTKLKKKLDEQPAIAHGETGYNAALITLLSNITWLRDELRRLSLVEREQVRENIRGQLRAAWQETYAVLYAEAQAAGAQPLAEISDNEIEELFDED
jgi:hypothetical protein